jgi:spoIIIJ-associated protein
MLDQDPNYRVLVDVGGYREERNSKLEDLALQKADDVRILGEAIELPPMKPSDRRAVHVALSQFDDIATESEGEGRDRYVVIKPVK